MDWAAFIPNLTCGKTGKLALGSRETRGPLSRRLWRPGRWHCFTSFGESVCCSWQQKCRLQSESCEDKLSDKSRRYCELRDCSKEARRKSKMEEREAK